MQMAANLTTVGRTPKVGDKAPEIDLVSGKDAHGTVQRFRLHEAVKRGPVIVAFFPGAFTGTCTKEMACFTNDWNQYAKFGAQFIGISVDSPQSQKAWSEKNGYKVAFASDFERSTIRAWDLVWDAWWGPVSKRATFIVDREGIVRYVHVQADANPEPPYQEIQAALAKLR